MDWVYACVNRNIPHSFVLYVIQSGGFYSAEDADSLPSHDAKDKKEGAFCVWTEKEARELLCDKLEGTDVSLSDVFCRHFNVREGGNVSFEQVNCCHSNRSH